MFADEDKGKYKDEDLYKKLSCRWQNHATRLEASVTSTSIQYRSHDFYSLGGVCGPAGHVESARVTPLLLRGRACGRTYKRITVRVDKMLRLFGVLLID